MPLLLADLGSCVENKENFYAVMDGTYIPSNSNDVDPFVKKFIAALARSNTLKA